MTKEEVVEKYKDRFWTVNGIVNQATLRSIALNAGMKKPSIQYRQYWKSDQFKGIWFINNRRISIPEKTSNRKTIERSQIIKAYDFCQKLARKYKLEQLNRISQ
jgi:hypothetical protein